MATRVGVVLFPGSNCELDVVEAVRGLGGEAEILWHGEASLGRVDAVVVPGGFAHGDYLRPGAIARFSPIMGAVADFAAWSRSTGNELVEGSVQDGVYRFILRRK